ncbi:MAG: UrcA family protein [Pseudomonadota bacterium]
MRTATIIAAAFVAAAALPAAAQEFEFNFQQHELATSGGTEALMSRLENRIEAFCTSSGRKSLQTIANERACVDDMMERAMEQIDDPDLSALFAQSRSSDYAG